MDRYSQEAVKLRRHLHTIPEGGFREYETSRFISSCLEDMGYEPLKTAGTGVYVFIDNNCEKTALFRCDMDGLAVKEETSLPFSSQNDGFMHACGHDGHMAIMLTFAKYLKENTINSSHNLLLLFQPAEENPGGAKDIAESGIFEKYNITRAYAIHLSPSHPYGLFHSKAGEFFASGVELYIDITGKGSHGASPHMGCDAILASCSLVSSLHTIISRNLDPIKDGVITIGTINGGSAMNVIAEKVSLSGTLRAFNDETKDLLVKRVREVCEGTARTFGTDIDFRPVYCYPPVINDENIFRQAENILSGRMVSTEKVMMSEDFSYITRKVPGLMMFLGTDDNLPQHRYPLHSPHFDFDDRVLIKGVEGFIMIAENI